MAEQQVLEEHGTGGGVIVMFQTVLPNLTPHSHAMKQQSTMEVDPHGRQLALQIQT